MQEAFAAWRNRLFMSRRFQRTALSLPLIRGIARRRAGLLFDVCAGFVYSQVLAACVELEIFTKLRTSGMKVEALASAEDVPVIGLLRLLKAAQALELLELSADDNRVFLGPQGAALLANPSVFDMVRHHSLLYRDLQDPVNFLRQPKGETHLGAFWGYAQRSTDERLNPGEAEAYSSLMATTQTFVSEEILEVYDFSQHRSIMDVGGGAGAFLCAVAAQARQAELTLFDLPTVIPQAEARFRAEGLESRTRTIGGNFHQATLPSGAELITLIRVLHDHDDVEVRHLLKKAYDALPTGGTLMVAEPMAGTKGAKAMGDAYFGLYLWAMGTGEPRSATVLSRMMSEAGFSRVKPRKTKNPLLTGVLIGQK